MSEAKCPCSICSQPISFPEAMTGQAVECPHCKMETILFIPSAHAAGVPLGTGRLSAPVTPKPSAPPATGASVTQVETPTIVYVLTFFSLLEFLGGIIAGLLGLTSQTDPAICFTIFAGSLLGGFIILGFASIIESANESAKRLARIEQQTRPLKATTP